MCRGWEFKYRIVLLKVIIFWLIFNSSQLFAESEPVGGESKSAVMPSVGSAEEASEASDKLKSVIKKKNAIANLTEGESASVAYDSESGLVIVKWPMHPKAKQYIIEVSGKGVVFSAIVSAEQGNSAKFHLTEDGEYHVKIRAQSQPGVDLFEFAKELTFYKGTPPKPLSIAKLQFNKEKGLLELGWEGGAQADRFFVDVNGPNGLSFADIVDAKSLFSRNYSLVTDGKYIITIKAKSASGQELESVRKTLDVVMKKPESPQPSAPPKLTALLETIPKESAILIKPPRIVQAIDKKVGKDGKIMLETIPEDQRLAITHLEATKGEYANLYFDWEVVPGVESYQILFDGEVLAVSIPATKQETKQATKQATKPETKQKSSINFLAQKSGKVKFGLRPLDKQARPIGQFATTELELVVKEPLIKPPPTLNIEAPKEVKVFNLNEVKFSISWNAIEEATSYVLIPPSGLRTEMKNKTKAEIALGLTEPREIPIIVQAFAGNKLIAEKTVKVSVIPASVEEIREKQKAEDAGKRNKEEELKQARMLEDVEYRKKLESSSPRITSKSGVTVDTYEYDIHWEHNAPAYQIKLSKKVNGTLKEVGSTTTSFNVFRVEKLQEPPRGEGDYLVEIRSIFENGVMSQWSLYEFKVKAPWRGPLALLQIGSEPKELEALTKLAQLFPDISQAPKEVKEAVRKAENDASLKVQIFASAFSHPTLLKIAAVSSFGRAQRLKDINEIALVFQDAKTPKETKLKIMRVIPEVAYLNIVLEPQAPSPPKVTPQEPLDTTTPIDLSMAAASIIKAGLNSQDAEIIKVTLGQIAVFYEKTQQFAGKDGLTTISETLLIEPLKNLLGNPDPNIYKATTEVLKLLGEPAFNPLLDTLKTNPAPLVQARAITLLGEIGQVAAIEPIIARLNHKEPQVSIAAKEALFNIGPASVPKLIESLASKDLEMRWQAKEVLKNLAIKKKLDKTALDLLRDALRHKQVIVSSVAYDILTLAGERPVYYPW